MTDELKPPRLEGAPGLVWRKRKAGWAAVWQPRTDLVNRGYSHKNAEGQDRQSEVIAIVDGELSDAVKGFIIETCKRWQGHMLAWSHDGVPVQLQFDGTLRSLINCYQTDPDSGYGKIRYRTRLNYNSMLRRLERQCGDELIANLRTRTIIRWYEDWCKIGVATAHSLVDMMRTLLGFGGSILENEECARLKGLLHNMNFKMSKPREKILTAKHVIAIRAKAHEMGLPSIALAQAFQFECTLRQKDVIGEWIPIEEPGASDVINHRTGKKWMRGLRWQEIDQALVLRHTTSKRQKDIEVALRLAPMVMEELEKIGLDKLPASGPIVISERTLRPYRARQFIERWRKVARAAGVPDDIFNMDSRAGAITEATDSGAALEDVRHAATHSDVAMTQRYSRAQAQKTATVMDLRVKHRNKKET